MLRRSLLLFIWLFSSTMLLAQQPEITNVDPVNGYPNASVFIAGSGFGTTLADIKVWFGGVEGNVIDVTNNLIEVEAPPQAHVAKVRVLNVSSGLMDSSDEIFFLSHSGSTFNVSQLSTPSEFFNSTTQEIFDICSCDLDNDGLPDIAATVTAGGTSVKILKNTSTPGSVNFTEFTSADFPVLNTGFPLRNIGCSDLNGDGKIDLYTSRNGQEKIFIFQNTNSTPGTMSFTAAPMEVNLEPFTAGEPVQPRRLEAADLTGDGKPELIITNDKEGSLNILINESTSGILFNATQKIINVNGMTSTAGLQVQDIDQDGRKDLILTQRFASDVFILRNIGAGNDITFATPFTINSATTVNVTTADYDNDGRIDILVNEISSDRVSVFKNTSSEGSFSFSAPVVIATGDEPWIGHPGDLNGDGLLDIIISNKVVAGQTEFTVAINSGSFTFNTSSQAISRPTRNLNVLDYDGDGKPDLAFVSSASGSFAIQVLRNSNCYNPFFFNETPLSICSGQTLRLEVPDAPGATFNWTKDGTGVAGTENFLDITASGTYAVEVVAEGGACSNTASITVDDGTGTVPSNPGASNNGPSCVGGEVTLSVDEVATATYSWTGPNGFTSTERTPTITNITTEDAGQYSVRVQLGACQSSESTTTVVVNQPPQFSISATGATTVCTGTSVGLSTQNQTGFTYQWLRDGTDIGGATNSTYSATTTGAYSVRVEENASNCVVITDEIQVTVLDQPVASFDFSGSTCEGSTVTFTSTSTVDANATVVYSWDFNADGTEDATGASATNTFNAAGDYSVSLTVSYTTGSGCTSDISTQSVTINTPVTLTIDATQTAICPGETAALSIPDTFTNINWSSGETTASITVSTAATYTVSATDVNGCTSNASIEITELAAPTITITANGEPGPISVTSGTEVQLEAQGADTFVWSPADFLSDPAIANPVATPTSEITYTVTGTTIDGCTGTAEISITLQPEGEITITPPKAFSPNGDGNNDFWVVEGIENFTDCTMSIFDEKGSLIFRQTGYTNEWDGTFEGKPLPEGVYYFIFSCSQQQPVTGSILLVK